MTSAHTFQLGDVCLFIRNGFSVKQSSDAGGLPITRIETISQAKIDPTKVGFAGLTLPDAERWLLKPGDILFSHINSPEHIGKSAIYMGAPEQLIHGMNLLCLRPDTTKVEPRFLLHYLRAEKFRSKLRRFVNKAVNQASISTSNLKTISLSVPSLPEQRRIAAILDQADALRHKRRTTLKYLDDLSQSIFLDMFGDPLNGGSYPMRPIGEIGSVTTGNTPPRSQKDLYGKHIEWIKSDNINTPARCLTVAKEYLSPEGAALARVASPGAILITCIAGSPSVIGNVAIADRMVAFNQQINAFMPHSGETEFWYIQLKLAKRLVQQASTGGMKGLVSKSSLQKVKLICPPTDAMAEFARQDQRVASTLQRCEASQQGIDALFESIESRAFQGEL